MLPFHAGVISGAKLIGGTIIQPSLWMTGDDGFVDISENSHVVTTSGSPTQTGLIYNSHKALRLDGSDDFFRVDSASALFNSSSWEIMTAMAHPTSASFEPAIVWLNYNSNNSYSYVRTRDTDLSNGSAMDIKTASDGVQDLADAVDVGAGLHVLDAYLDGTSTSLQINDDTPTTGSITTHRTDNDTIVFGALVRSANPSGASFGDYDFAEILIFNRKLTAPERTYWKDSLQSKYAL
jgi:hypothetical protein